MKTIYFIFFFFLVSSVVMAQSGDFSQLSVCSKVKDTTLLKDKDYVKRLFIEVIDSLIYPYVFNDSYFKIAPQCLDENRIRYTSVNNIGKLELKNNYSFVFYCIEQPYIDVLNQTCRFKLAYQIKDSKGQIVLASGAKTNSSDLNVNENNVKLKISPQNAKKVKHLSQRLDTLNKYLAYQQDNLDILSDTSNLKASPIYASFTLVVQEIDSLKQVFVQDKAFKEELLVLKANTIKQTGLFYLKKKDRLNDLHKKYNKQVQELYPKFEENELQINDLVKKIEKNKNTLLNVKTIGTKIYKQY